MTCPPSQNTAEPLAVIFGVVGGVGSLKASVIEFEEQPLPSINEIVYDPAAKLEMVYGRVIPVAEPEEVPVQLRSPLPVPVTFIDPVAVPHELGSLAVVVILIVGVTLIVISTVDDVHPLGSK